MSMVGFDEKSNHYPSQLSAGQQHVAIARSLTMRPTLMLQKLSVIRKIGREHDLTMLMVTH